MNCTSKNDVWLTIQIILLIMISVSPVFPRSVVIFVTISLIVINIFHKKLRIDKSFLLLEVLFLFCALLDIRNTTGGQSYSLVNLMYPTYFACGYFIVQKYDRKVFLHQYECVLFCLAILSLIGMSVYYINPSWIYSFPTYVQNGATHHTLYFFNYLFSDGWMAVRNSGVAWEPGLFQLLLNIALYLAIKEYDGTKRFIRVLLYLVAIILTRSTIGYVIMIVNIFTLVKERKLYIVLIIITVIALGASINEELAYQLQYKLMGSSAFYARYEPLINAIKVTWYLPFGLGSTGYDELIRSINIGSFDSYTQILMRYGYPVLILIMLRLVKLIKEKEFGIAIIIAVGFLSEPIWGSALIAAFLFMKNAPDSIESMFYSLEDKT